MGEHATHTCLCVQASTHIRSTAVYHLYRKNLVQNTFVKVWGTQENQSKHLTATHEKYFL